MFVRYTYLRPFLFLFYFGFGFSFWQSKNPDKLPVPSAIGHVCRLSSVGQDAPKILPSLILGHSLFASGLSFGCLFGSSVSRAILTSLDICLQNRRFTMTLHSFHSCQASKVGPKLFFSCMTMLCIAKLRRPATQLPDATRNYIVMIAEVWGGDVCNSHAP